MHTVHVNGTTIGYEDHGPTGGVPVLLIHGHPFNRTMWHPQTRALALAGYRAIVPDLRGYGDSPVVPAVPGVTLLTDFARDLAAVLDHLGQERAVVCGLSMGGQIAMEFHRLFPQRVAALILADTSPRAETPEGKRSRNAMADRLLAEGMAGYADEVIGKMVFPNTITSAPDVAEHVLDMMRGTSPEGAAAALRGRAERPDYCAMLRQVAVPTLVVVGDEDTYTPVSEAEFLYQQLPDATLVILAGAAHLPNLERPAEFNFALGHFLGSRVGGP